MRKVLLLCFFISLNIFSSAQDKEFQYEVINSANGLNTNNINDCIKDNRGFLWIATDLGVTRYAYQHSLHIITNPKTTRPIGVQNKLLIIDSILYSGGGTGLYKINTNNCSFSKQDLKSDESINDMLFYKGQIIMANKEDHLIILDIKTGKVEKLKTGHDQIINLVVKDDLIYCLTITSKCLIFDINDRKINKLKILPKFNFRNKLYLSKNGDLLYLNKEKIKKIDKSSQTFIDVKNSIDSVSAYVEDKSGGFYYVRNFYSFFHQSQGKSPQKLTPPVHKSTEFRGLKADASGVIYILSNQGLIILQKIKPFTLLDVFHDGKAHAQRAIFEDTIGDRLLFFSYDKASLWDKRTGNFNVKDWNYLSHAALQIDDNLLIASEAGTVYSIDLHTLNRQKLFPNPIPAIQFISIGKNHKNEIFLGALNGLYTLRGPKNELVHLPLKFRGDDFTKMTVKAIWVDKQDHLWVGGSFGILILNQQLEVIDRYSTFSKGLRKLPVDEVNCFYPTPSGIYAGLDGDLVFIPFNRSAPKFLFSAVFGKSTNRIVSILEDNYHDIWFASYSGIYRLHPTDNTIRAFHAPFYFTNDEFNRSSSCKTKNGKLYFGNVAEYVEIDPVKYRDDVALPSFEFNNIRVFKNNENELLRYDVKNGDTLSLPQEGSSMGINFSLNDPLNSNRFTYQYRLANLNDKWVDLGSTSSVQLFSLSAGKHDLQLRAIGNDGYSSNILKLYIIVPAFFYKTIWFNFIIISLILAIGFSFYIIRIRNLKKLLQFRREISNELHDTVGTSVTKSIYLAQAILNESKSGDQRVQKIIDYGRQINSNFRDVLWSLEKETDSIVNLFDRIYEIGNSAVEHTNFDFSIIKENIDQDFPLSIRQKRDLLMITREAIHNALKHSNGNKIRLTFSLNENRLHVNIHDNGFNQDPEIKFTGMGLESMRLRAKKMGASKITFSKGETGFEIHLIL